MDIEDPRVVVTGNPVDGFTFYGPTPLADSEDSYQEVRTRRLQADGEVWWLAELRPLSDLAPIDGDRSGPIYPGDVQRAALAARVAQLGLDSGDLDDAVHDTASRAASAINNGGIDSQVAFLIDRLGADSAGELIDSLVSPNAAPSDV